MQTAQLKPYPGYALHGMLLLLLMAGCSSGNYRAPVSDIGDTVSPVERSTVVLRSGPRHRVNEGETLYAIAWMYDLDYSALARANGIQTPYTIFPGQELTLDISAIPASAPAVGTTVTTPATVQNPPVVNRSTSGNAQTRAGGTQNALLRWMWPANGDIVGRYSNVANANKGIDISGSRGDPVFAAEAGEVVYVGNALLRYGELIIIKHNDQFLSAYAHNDSISVSEGDRVSRGQRIASLGSTGIDRTMLHFEIRLGGQPVDPSQYLPPR